MITTLKDWLNENSNNIVELTFIKVDENTGNLVYRGDNGKKYMSLEGEIHNLTNEGEPLAPVKNVIVKDGEPVYDPADRFGRNLEFTLDEQDELEDEHGFSRINNFSFMYDVFYIDKKGKNLFKFVDNKNGNDKEFDTVKKAIEYFKLLKK